MCRWTFDPISSKNKKKKRKETKTFKYNDASHRWPWREVAAEVACYVAEGGGKSADGKKMGIPCYAAKHTLEEANVPPEYRAVIDSKDLLLSFSRHILNSLRLSDHNFLHFPRKHISHFASPRYHYPQFPLFPSPKVYQFSTPAGYQMTYSLAVPLYPHISSNTLHLKRRYLGNLKDCLRSKGSRKMEARCQRFRWWVGARVWWFIIGRRQTNRPRWKTRPIWTTMRTRQTTRLRLR